MLYKISCVDIDILNPKSIQLIHSKIPESPLWCFFVPFFLNGMLYKIFVPLNGTSHKPLTTTDKVQASFFPFVVYTFYTYNLSLSISISEFF